MSKVRALVVTRNRKELLIECVRSLLAQTHPVAGVIVFDNASTDGTEQALRAAGLLDRDDVRFERSERNTGGAGGYAEILRMGCDTDADWLWLMDDDAEPEPDALRRLLASPVAADPGSVALCTSVVHLDGSVDPLHRCRLGRFVTPLPLGAYAPGTHADVDCASFVGLFVRAGAARTAGLPRREFFLGYDDAEYSVRLRRQGRIRLVPESRIVHKIVVGGGEATGRSRRWNRLLRTHYTSSPWPSYWKDLYRLRNLIALKVQHERLGRPELALLIGGYTAKTLLYEERPLRRIPWLVRFAVKGYRGDFSAPTPEQWAAYAGSSGAPPAPRPGVVA